VRNVALAIFVLFNGLAFADTNPPVRPPNWAEAVKLEGMSNFYKLSDRLYRSDQPGKDGLARLNELGIKTVVNLRSFHSDRKKMGNTAMAYEHIYMKAWHPEEKEVVRFLRLVTDESSGPILVHCQHGADRTGLMCAVYRVAVQGWTKEEAVKEMTQGGYNFHGVWQNLIRWFHKLDIEKVRKAAGIDRPQPVSNVNKP